MAIVSRLREYARAATVVARDPGVPRWSQALEVARLALGDGRIGPGDYYTYALYDPHLSPQDKREFVGWRAESRLDALNDSRWRALGLDKVLMYSVLDSDAIPVPRTRAIYLDGRERPLADATPLTSAGALRAWLRDPANYPFFSKPSASGFGRSAFLAAAVDVERDCVELADGAHSDVDSLARAFDDREHLGYLFQQPLQADPRLVPLIGGIVSSLRFMLLVDEADGPLVHRAFWKLPTGRNMHDNYNGGATGNLAAALDLETGRITRAINGFGLALVEVGTHPDTHQPLVGVGVPDWPQVVAFAQRAALVFPKLGFQQWDIALTDRGPVALEVNLYGTGGCDLTQLLYHRGLCDARMRDFLRRHRRLDASD